MLALWRPLVSWVGGNSGRQAITRANGDILPIRTLNEIWSIIFLIQKKEYIYILYMISIQYISHDIHHNTK